MTMRKCIQATAIGMITLASGVAFADVTCIVPQLSKAQLQETADQQLNEANCSSGDAARYESLLHMSGWTGLTAPQCVGATWPKQRFLNAARSLDKAEASMVYSVDLDNGWETAQLGKSNKPGCTSGSAYASTASNGSISYFWKFFYETSVVERAATIIHEATHSGLGKAHLTGDVTIIGENSCHMAKLSYCDSSWTYGGAWQHEVKWLEAYATKGSPLVSSPNARRLAQDIGNNDLNTAFVARPMLRGVPRTITCTGC
jgi:hypothetical protein